MRYIMMGTGPFAVPTFQSLLQSSHETVALFTKPARGIPGSHRQPPTPMADLARSANIPTYTPDDVNQPDVVGQLEQLGADILVVCDYGQILKKPALQATRLGGVNLHGSLLPKYRGAAPINWALIHGEKVTGITVIHMNTQLDAGPSLVRRETPIGPEEDAVELERRLSELGAPAVLEALELLESWDGFSLLGEIQDRGEMTRAPRLKKSDGEIDWNWGANQIHNRVRGLRPWPGTYTYWNRDKGNPQRLIVHQVALPTVPEEETAVDKSTVEEGVVEGGAVPLEATRQRGEQEAGRHPGKVVRAAGNDLWIATGNGQCVALAVVQPAGKRAMSASEFLRGHRLEPGDQLG
jgi:methionyl-tRNA formyltransferase